METIVIVILGAMLIIALLQIRSKNFDNEALTNKLDAECKANICNVKKQKELQKDLEEKKQHLKESERILKERSKQYHCAQSIIESRDMEIIKLEKTKKEYSLRVYELSNEKAFAIKETKSAVKLCKESVATIAHLRAELDAMELLLTLNQN